MRLTESIDGCRHRQPAAVGLDGAVGRWFDHAEGAGGTHFNASQSLGADSWVNVGAQSGPLIPSIDNGWDKEQQQR